MRFVSLTRWCAAVATALTMGALIWISIGERASGDSTIMLYLGWLVDQGMVPYRDFFDVHPPGAFLVYGVLGRLSGYSDVMVPYWWAAWLLLNGAGMWLVLRRFGLAVATLGACGAIIAILPFMFQRAGFLLPVLTLSLWALTTGQPRPLAIILIGAGFGAGATIRPQLAIGLIPVAVFLWQQRSSPLPVTHRVTWLAAGFVLPIGAAAMYLVTSNTWSAFASIAWNYWPLYARLPLLQSAGERLLHELAMWLPLLIAISGSWWLRRHRRSRDPVEDLLAMFAIAYLAYVPLNGNFFDQHWLPFLWCALPLIAITARLRPSGGRPFAELAGVAATVLAVGCAVRAQHTPELGFLRIDPHYFREIDSLTTVLREQEPDTVVQPLDWANGTAQALLNARRKPATRFAYTLPLLHNTSSVYVRALRREFISEFDTTAPAVILRFKNLRSSFFPGERPFMRLRTRIRRDYQPVMETERFVILERRPTPGATATPLNSEPYTLLPSHSNTTG